MKFLMSAAALLAALLVVSQAVPFQQAGGPGPALMAPFAGGPEALREQVVASYVEVRNPKGGRGSGTVIWVGEEKLVLTASHVVQGSDKVRLYREDGRGRTLEWGGTVVKSSAPEEDGGMDLALVRSDLGDDGDGHLTAARLAASDRLLFRGEPAWYCGSGGGIYGNLEQTILNRFGYAPEGFKTRFTLVNGNGYFGHSGSGVFVRRGQEYIVVGVVLRIFGDYPKTPVMCRELADVTAFVREYQEQQSE